MARGFDSKNVEEQQAEALRKPEGHREQRSEKQIQAARERAMLELQLARVQADLSRATNERHRAMLEAAKSDLEERIAAM